jgi:adenylosuccinate synthase
MCIQEEVRELEVYYVLRSYMTRHGEGPFPSEDPDLIFEDRTNVHNQFQGGLRFGKLDYSLIREAINKDIKWWHRGSTGLKIYLAVNCLDQYFMDIQTVEQELGFPVALISFGPERDAIIRRPNESDEVGVVE